MNELTDIFEGVDVTEETLAELTNGKGEDEDE